MANDYPIQLLTSGINMGDYYDKIPDSFTFNQMEFPETLTADGKSLLGMLPPVNGTGLPRKTRNTSKRNWRQRWEQRPKTPQGYDSDGSCKSLEESSKAKSASAMSLYSPFHYAHCDTPTSVFFNALPLHPHPNCHKIKSRPHHRRDRRHLPEEIVRRVHGLMERFTSRAQLFDIEPSLFNGRGELHWNSLNQDIWNVFSSKAQKRETYVRKLQLWSQVYLHIRNLMERFGLFMVGSTMTGLGLENSDIDMCLLVRPSSNDSRTDAVNWLSLIREAITRCDFAKDPQVIPAKVPILKFRGVLDDFQVDLNCNNAVGIRNTHLLHCYTRLDWRVRPLVMIVKVWAQANRINDAKNMTISSYSLALMVIHFLQSGVSPSIVPCLHVLYPKKFDSEREIHDIDVQEEIPGFNSDNGQTLGELLIGFLEYYTYFRFDTYAISVRRGSHVAIDECRYARAQKNDPHQWKYLCIEEPFDLTNTARSVYDFEAFRRIRRVFLSSYNVLRETENLYAILTNLDEAPPA